MIRGVLATKENRIPTSQERIFVAKAREYPYADVCSVVCSLTALTTKVTIPGMVKLMKKAALKFKSKNSEYEQYDIE